MHPASEPLDQLTERLRALREGLTGEALAGVLGWSPSKVSKTLGGKRIPSEKDIREIAEATGHPELIGELLVLRQQAETVHTRWRRPLDEGGEAGVQQDLDEATQNATRICCAEVSVIPGLLQAPGYARGIFTQVKAIYPDIDVDSAVEGRMRRREIIHEETGPGVRRKFEFVISYGALVNLPCPPDDMLTQLNWLLMNMDLANVTIGIIPQGRQLPMSLYNGFMLLDDLLVVESYGYEDQVTGELAAAHARIFTMLMDQSAKGEDARKLIAAAAAGFREE